MANSLGKVIYVLINGQSFRCKHDSQWSAGGRTAEAQAADGQAYVGTTGEPTPGGFNFTLLDANDIDITEINGFRNMLLMFVHDHGAIYSMADANWSDPLEVQNGEIPCAGFGKDPKRVPGT